MNPTLRLMTYNVHNCVGTDRRLDPGRIAAVIAHYEPDIVALQELDVARMRSGQVDQAGIIAADLKMNFHFHPALRIAGEQYGDAILSRWPMCLRGAGELPTTKSWLAFEPRGALWVSITSPSGVLEVFNTHLGLSHLERQLQIEALLGSEWLQAPVPQGPQILCGDLNALPGSAVLRRIFNSGLRDAQRRLPRYWPRATYPSRFPLLRLDHVFCSPGIEVRQVIVPQTPQTKVASDHLPLIVDFSLPTPPI